MRRIAGGLIGALAVLLGVSAPQAQVRSPKAIEAPETLRAVVDTSKPPPPTIADLVLLLKSYAPDLAKIERFRAELDKPIPESGDPVDLARAWHIQARAAEELGENNRWLAALNKALAYAEKTKTSASPNSNDEMGFLPRIRHDRLQAVRVSEGLGAAIDATVQFASDFRGTRLSGAALGELAALSTYYVRSGNLEQASKTLDDAENGINLLRRNPWSATYSAGWTMAVEYARGILLLGQSKHDEAELAFHAAIRMAEQNASDMTLNRAAGRSANPQERCERYVDNMRLQLARVYREQQRLDEAELLLREVLKSSLKRDGRNSRLVGNTLTSLGGVFLRRGRYAEALVIIEWAERTLTEAGYPFNSFEQMAARKLQAQLLTTLGRYAEAAKLFDGLQTLAAGEAREGEVLSVTTLDTVAAYVAVDRVADALVAGDKMLADHTRFYGADHYFTAQARAYRAVALQRSSRGEEARKEFERAIAVVIDPDKSVGKRQASAARTDRLRQILNGYLDVLIGKVGEPSPRDAAEAFRIADVARWQSVQKAVSGSALRAVAGTPELGARIKKVQDDDDELQAVYTNLIAQHSAPPDKQLPIVIAAMEKRIVALQKEQTDALVEIRRQFPQYDALVNPRPVDLATAGKALLANEALVSVYVTATGTYVWALNGPGGTQGQVKFHYSPKNADWVAERVKRIRAAVDLSAGGDTRQMRFDLDAASALYQELLAPVEAAWAQADTLLVVANESLGQIPFSLLPTKVAPLGEPEAGLALSQYRQVPWLGRKLAVAHLPSVSALVTLRAIPASKAQRDPFIGFGDPDFGGTPTTRLAGVARGVRNLKISHAEKWDGSKQGADATASIRAVTTEEPVLLPLPDTRDEIIAIATALQADAGKDVFFGAQANPLAVTGADLKRHRIVAFATHGLMAGDLPGLDQPALALSPQPGKNIRDGLLKLEDILKLSLDADLVVLSACNTAAADGGGSEAVSGLGRAFFYAGARSVLATHWAVETVSARQLVTELFQRYARDGTMTRAKALQQAMLELIDRGADSDERGHPLYSYAHPAFWAPYALYGDPGR